jgi:phosphohistidine swiveling domain-containing protein
VQARWLTDWVPSRRWPHYTRANAGEVLPEATTPLGWTYGWEKAMLPGWVDGLVRQGSYLPGELDAERPEIVGLFGGYFYLNLSALRLLAVRNPMMTVEQFDTAWFGDHPDVPPYVPQPGDGNPALEQRTLEHIGWLTSDADWPELDADRGEVAALRQGRPDLAALSAAELVARARWLQPVLRRLWAKHPLSSGGAGLAAAVLGGVAQAAGMPGAATDIMASLGDVDSAAPSLRMWEMSRLVRSSAGLTAAFDAGVNGLLDRLRQSPSADAAQFLTAWESFSFEFGSRGVNEWDLASATWETDPELALTAVAAIRHQSDAESPAARHAHAADLRSQTIAKLRRAVKDQPELAASAEAGINALRCLQWRERTKTNVIRALHEARVVFRELGRRAAANGHLGAADQVFMLLDDELEAFVADPAPFTETLRERSAAYAELADLDPPFIIPDGDVKPLSQWPRRRDKRPPTAESGTVLTGVAGCGGVATGTARVVLTPDDCSHLHDGDIIVAPFTDVAWTPLFMAAAAVVVEVGGQVSHAVIVSRELGLPCVVSVTDATTRIPDGAKVTVDGSAGTVTLV